MTKKQNLTWGKDFIFFEVIDQLDASDTKGIQTTFSKLRVGSSPNSKTSQVANVIPLASNYLESWKGVGPLHDLKPGKYRSILEKKGLVRCSLVETDNKPKDPTEYALKNKSYSWQHGAGSLSECGQLTQELKGFYPLATIQQGNFIFSFFQPRVGGQGKILIWSIESFEKELQSGKLQLYKGSYFNWDEPTQLIVEPTSLSPVEESKNSDDVHGSEFPDKQIQFTFGAPLTTAQSAFNGNPEAFLFRWVEIIEVQSEGETYHYRGESKPVETTLSALNLEELESYYKKDNITIYPLNNEGNKLQFVEGNIYTIGRDIHCKMGFEYGRPRRTENILAGFETPNLNTRYGFSLTKDTEDLFAEALTQAEESNTYSILDIDFEEESY